MTCRSQEKCDRVVASLLADTGKPPAFFGSVVLDLDKTASIQAAVEAFPKVDRLCLNAGGLGVAKPNLRRASGSVSRWSGDSGRVLEFQGGSGEGPRSISGSN